MNLLSDVPEFRKIMFEKYSSYLNVNSKCALHTASTVLSLADVVSCLLLVREGDGIT